jgi:hypothetical protein
MDEQFNIGQDAVTGPASQHPQDPIPHAVDSQVVLEIDPIAIYERMVACGRENVEFPNRTIPWVRTGWNDKDGAVRLRGHNGRGGDIERRQRFLWGIRGSESGTRLPPVIEHITIVQKAAVEVHGAEIVLLPFLSGESEKLTNFLPLREHDLKCAVRVADAVDHANLVCIEQKNCDTQVVGRTWSKKLAASRLHGRRNDRHTIRIELEMRSTDQKASKKNRPSQKSDHSFPDGTK